MLNKKRIEVQRPSSAVIYDDWKLLYTWETNSSSLFNLKDDLGETTDLARDKPLKTAYLRRKLMIYLSIIGAQIPRNNEQYNPSKDPLKKRSITLQRELMLFDKKRTLNRYGKAKQGSKMQQKL